MTNEELAKKLMSIFQGMENGHGTYNPQVKDAKGKLVGHAEFVHEPATLTTWINHVEGLYGIGIGPINNSSMCHWGAIDIDDYNVSHLDLINKITQKQFPLIVVKSKSGGAHLMMFLTDWVPAVLVKDKLTEMAAALGYAFDSKGKATEVFPRQTQILSDRGDCGNWLNIPYFGANNSSRYALDSKAEKLSIEEFIEQVAKIKITEKQLASLTIEVSSKSNSEFKDAPFCLSLIVEEGGIVEGNRNSFIHNMGILAHKMHPNNKDVRNALIEEWNNKYCTPSLPASEVCSIQNSLDRHPDYRYQCKDPLLKPFCNVAICRSKKHGLSTACLMPACSDLLKLNSNPSVYFLQVNDVRVEFPSTDDLINQNKFNTHCVEQANVMPPTMKKADWTELVNSWLQDMRIIEAPLDASIDAKLEELLESFAEQMNAGFDKQDIARNLPWLDPATGKTIFRLSGLENFLLANKFTKLNRGQLVSKLKAWGAESKQMKINGRNFNVWQIQLDNVTNTAYEVKLMTEKDIL